MNARTHAQPRFTQPLVLVGLIGLSLFINYVDRANLTTGAKQISAEMEMSATQ